MTSSAACSADLHLPVSSSPSATPDEAELPSPQSFDTLVRWRRDVRRFKPDPVDPAVLAHILETAHLAPSVGNSQPWRIVSVEARERRQTIHANFTAANENAAAHYDATRAARYRDLKLAGFDRAPVHLAIFCDCDPVAGHSLGRRTQPLTLDYSCAGLVTILWLAARTHGIGLGWVSILDGAAINATLDVPASWRFIAYLLLGYPEEEHEDPELVRHGWQARGSLQERYLIR